LNLRTLIARLRTVLSEPLPGAEAHSLMATEGRKLRIFEHRHTAAVLISLFQADSGWRFPLIQRVEDGFVHSGQIGFPGGRVESGESTVDAASVKVIGQLSPLPIPVSGNLVHPVVGVIGSEPVWRVNHGEVRSMFTVAVKDVLSDDHVQVEIWQFSMGPRRVPFFHLDGHKVWGATAMILSEFRVVMNRIFLME
jgi:hypothetical protein